MIVSTWRLLKKTARTTLLGFVLAVAGASAGAAEDSACLIEPSGDVKLGVPADGVLELLMVERGDEIRKGQLLGRLNTGIEVAQARTLAAKVGFGDRKLKRNLDLKDRQLIAPQELDELETNRRVSEFELAEIEERLKLRSMTAPFDGVVVDVYFQQGSLVKQEHILRVARLDPLYVELILPAARFGSLRMGQVIEVTPELDRRRLSGRVVSLDRVIDASSGSFRVRLAVPNPGNRIPSGQRCQARF
jgi:membrane fusion protein (multidrug efflux system)